MKDQVLPECEAPGASVAKVAMSHGINANILHSWRKLAREAQPTMARQEFVPVAVAPLRKGAATRGIRCRMRRGAMTIKLLWPMRAAAELAAWTRELLR